MTGDRAPGERERSCPDCGAGFASASALADHALSAHVHSPTPAAHIRPLRHPTGLRIATAIALLVGAAFWVLFALELGGALEKPSAPESPNSVAHGIAAELVRDGEIEEFRAVEPDEGWDTEYELDGGDGVIHARNEGTSAAELEYFAYPSDLDEALERAAERRGYSFGD